MSGGGELRGCCCSVSVVVVVGCHRGAVGQLEQAATVRDAGRRGGRGGGWWGGGGVEGGEEL